MVRGRLGRERVRGVAPHHEIEHRFTRLCECVCALVDFAPKPVGFQKRL